MTNPAPNTPFHDLVIVTASNSGLMGKKVKGYQAQGYAVWVPPRPFEDVLIDFDDQDGASLKISSKPVGIAFLTKKD